jgi:HEAT repeat protein
MRFLFLAGFSLSLVSLPGYCAPEKALDLGSLGPAKAEIQSTPLAVVVKNAAKVLLKIEAPSAASLYDASRPPQVNAYPLGGGAVAVSVRFFLKAGGEDLSVWGSPSGSLKELFKENLPEDPGLRYSFFDLNGDGSVEILKYRTDELAILCDGATSFIGAAVYDVKTGTFAEFEVPPLSSVGSLRPVAFTPPERPNPSIALFRAASSRDGASGVASVADILSDNNAATAWVEGRTGSGLGEFATASLYGSRSIVAVGLQTPSLSGVTPPKAVLLALGNGARGNRVGLTIPEDTKPGSTLWYRLTTPIKASCASVIFSEAPVASTKLGLAEVRLVSLQELSPKEAFQAFLEDLHSGELEKVAGAIEGIVVLPPNKDIEAAINQVARDPLEKISTRVACLTILQRRGVVSSEVFDTYLAALGSVEPVLQKAAKQAILQNQALATKLLRDAFVKEPQVMIAKTIEELIAQGADPSLLVPALVASLGVGSDEVVLSVRRALISSGAVCINEVVQRLSAPSSLTRMEAARVLGGLFATQDLPSAVVDALIKRLSVENAFEPTYAMLAALSYAKQHQDKVIPVMIQVLQKNSEEAIRARAAKALGGFPEISTSLIESLLEDTSPMVRREVLRLLAERKEASSVSVVVGALSKDLWSLVRAEAANTAAALRQEESDAALVKSLGDPSKMVAFASIQAMRTFDRKSLSWSLRALVANEKASKARRVEAAYALGELGNPEDAKQLLSTLQGYRLSASQSEDAEDLVGACALSLAALHYKAAYEALELLVTEGPGPVLQKTGVRALGVLGDLRAVPLLRKAANQKEDPILAKVAREALERLGAH